jgi:hypothetical protein
MFKNEEMRTCLREKRETELKWGESGLARLIYNNPKRIRGI